MLPNFLIIGAPKCGTASLRYYLSQHPHIYMYPEEIHFFDNEFHRGVEWYESHFDGGAGQSALGEKTAYYIYPNAAPGRIAEVLPHVKLIAIFRNPVDRACSHYWHRVKAAEERRPLEEALEPGSIYMAIGRYAHHVERYLRFFPRDQMLFLLFEDMLADPSITLREVYNFLSVPADFVCTRTRARHNVGWAPRSLRLQLFLGRLTHKRSLRGSLIGRAARGIERLNRTDGYPPVQPETRALLGHVFDSDNERLARLLGRDLAGWGLPPGT